MTSPRKQTAMLALVHLASYPLLIWLYWIWLGIAESSTGRLAASAILGLIIVGFLGWLLATAFEGSLRVRGTWLRAIPFVVIALVLIGVALWLSGYRTAVADWLAIKVSALRGKAVNPRSFDWPYALTIWVLVLVALAVLIPPHFTRTWRLIRDWRYWAVFAGMAVIVCYGSWRIVTWVPPVPTLAGQAASMTIRFGLACVITVVVLLVFASVVRRLSGRAQPEVLNEPTPVT